MKVLICLTFVLGLVCVSQANFLSKRLDSYLVNTIDIPAGQSVNSSNPLPMNIKTSCQIQTSSPNPIQICNTPVSGTITINGQPLNNQTCFNNTNGETFTLTLSNGATLGLSNKGNYDVKSVCTLESELQQKSIMMIDEKYTIKAGQNTSINNPMPFSLTTDCTVSGLNGANVKCCVYGAKGTTTQNGQPLSPTTPICTPNVADSSVWKYTLTDGAEIVVNNQGTYDFTIDCVLQTLASDYI